MVLNVTSAGEVPCNFAIDLTQADDSSESATMAVLIKREMMRYPEMLPYVVETTQEREEVAKEYGIFDSRLDGSIEPSVMVDYFEKLGFFRDEDYKVYHEQHKNLKEHHPCNRAWIPYVNTLTVDKSFRRRHIGWTVVRKVMEAAVREAGAAGRPLLAGVRPGFLGPKGGDEAESEKFWRAMRFERHVSEFQPDLFFWGVSRGLPDEQPVA